MFILKIAPTSDSDFGRYNCTATNRIGTRYQEYTLGQAGKLKFCFLFFKYFFLL